MRTPGKRVYRKVTGVRIPPHPPAASVAAEAVRGGASSDRRRWSGTNKKTQVPCMAADCCHGSMQIDDDDEDEDEDEERAARVHPL